MLEAPGFSREMGTFYFWKRERNGDIEKLGYSAYREMKTNRE
jgi:hypothetical protein